MNRQFPIVDQGSRGGVVEYMQKVRCALANRLMDYVTFLETMWMHTAGELVIQETFARIIVLLEDNADLIREFKHFLPDGYCIVECQDFQPRFKLLRVSYTVPDPAFRTGAVNTEDEAVSFVAQVKERFLQTPEVFVTFLRIIRSLSQKGMNENALERAKVSMSILFKNHPDLMEKFHNFLSEDSTFEQDENIPDQSSTSYTHSSITTNSMMTAVHSPGRSFPTYEDAYGYLRRVKLAFAGKPSTYLTFLELMQQTKEKNLDALALISEVVRLFEGHNDLILDFTQFLPPE
jgi:histone deacetylase complex regulatory component SIN3